MPKLRRLTLAFILFFITISVFTSGFSQTIAPFCFPTEGTLGWRFNEGTHKGIDIWTGNYPEDAAPPGSSIHLVYDGKLEMMLEGRQYPGGPKDGIPQALVFSHEIDPFFTGKVPHLKVNTWYIHLANQETGESYINPNLEVGKVYPKGTFLGYQGNRKYYQTGSIEYVITHLHFDIRLSDNNTRIDPSSYLGFSLNYGNLDVLPKGTKFNNTCAIRFPFEILKPTQSAPVNAGPKDNPNKIEVEVTITAHGLNEDDFSIKIGNKAADVVSAVELSDKYVLEVIPPTQDANDLYDLTVSVDSASDTEIDAVQYGVGNADVPLVIDRSGSMSGTKIADARNAAKQYIDLMNNGDQVGVVSFSGDARVDFPLTLITSTNLKEQAKSAIDLLYASGVTSIGDGLQAGQDELNNRGDTTHAWAVILLSDGLENTPAYVADILPGIPEKTDVYTIALGSNADEALMQHIATETGGQYCFSPGPDELQEIYNSIRGGIAGEQTITSESGTVREGETKIETVIIDFLVSLVRFLVSWSGSDIDLTLTDPNGLVIDPNVASTDPNIFFTSGSTYEYYTIDSPTPGEWRMNIKGVDTPFGGEDYTARITGKSDLTLSTYFDKDRYETGQPITVLASLSDGSGPITGASVEVVVQAPSQSLSAWKSVNGDTVPTKSLRESVSTLKSLYKRSLNMKSSSQQSSSPPVFYLYDDGAHGDGRANDGVYGNLYTNTSNSGSYIFNFEASGITTGGSSFTRITTRSLFVAQATASGSISGTVSYAGSQTGTIYIQAWQSDPSMYGNPDYLTSISSPGSYILSNLPDSTYYLTSYMDSNGNGIRDENEPRGAYGPPHMPNSVIVSGGSQTSDVDITIIEGVISYPSPCYPDKGEVVKIANLPLNSKVHIYTISGELVRTLDDASEISMGGSSTTAFWDCRNDAGEVVARGIYIYLGTDDIGTKRTGKIAIIK